MVKKPLNVGATVLRHLGDLKLKGIEYVGDSKQAGHQESMCFYAGRTVKEAG